MKSCWCMMSANCIWPCGFPPNFTPNDNTVTRSALLSCHFCFHSMKLLRIFGQNQVNLTGLWFFSVKHSLFFFFLNWYRQFEKYLLFRKSLLQVWPSYILSCKNVFIGTRVVEFRGLKFERSSTVSHCNNGMQIYIIEIFFISLIFYVLLSQLMIS